MRFISLFIFSEQVSLKMLKLLILVFKVVGVSEIVLNIVEVLIIKQIKDTRDK